MENATIGQQLHLGDRIDLDDFRWIGVTARTIRENPDLVLFDYPERFGWTVYYDSYRDEEGISAGVLDLTRGECHATVTGIYPLDDATCVVAWEQGNLPAAGLGGRGWFEVSR